MTVRILHLADLHLERGFAGLGVSGELAHRRRQGLRDSLVRAGEEARRRGCDVITLGGDIYEHDRASPETGRFLASLLESWAPMRVFVSPGNHDPLLPGSLWDTVVWPANVHVFAEERLQPVELAPGLVIWGLGHRSPAFDGDPMDCAPVGAEGGVHIALFHGAEMGSRPRGKSAHGPFREDDVRRRGFRAALCGHYHRRRAGPDTGRVVYSGSQEPLTFDEEDEPRGPVVVEVTPGGDVRTEGLATNAWHVRQVEADVDGVQAGAAVLDRARQAVQAAVAGVAADHTMIRLTLRGEVSGDAAVDTARVEAVVAEATGVALVRLRDLTRISVDPESLEADHSARGAFVRELLAELESTHNPDERAVLEDALRYGLQALDGAEVGLR